MVRLWLSLKDSNFIAISPLESFLLNTIGIHQLYPTGVRAIFHTHTHTHTAEASDGYMRSPAWQPAFTSRR